eukprot:gene43040-52599_t
MYCHLVLAIICILLLICDLSIVGAKSSRNNADKGNCPVCIRILKASSDLARRKAERDKVSREEVFQALDDYCQLGKISTEDLQFCYNIQTIKGELRRLILLGADDKRVCQKVQTINPDFCKAVSESSNIGGKKSEETRFFKQKMGVIYI